MAYNLNLSQLIKDLKGPQPQKAISDELQKLKSEFSKFRDHVAPQAKAQMTAFESELKKRFQGLQKQAVEVEKSIEKYKKLAQTQKKKLEKAIKAAQSGKSTKKKVAKSRSKARPKASRRRTRN